MKYDPHYYIQKIGDSIDSLPYVEVTVDNTTNFSKEISGWYHDMSTDEIVIFHCCEHYVNRFNERYLRRCKRDDIGRIRIFAKRIAKAQLVDQSIAVDPSKRLINIIKIKAKGEYRHLHFITCYQSKEKVKKLLS